MQIQIFQAEDFSKHRVNLLKESVKQRTQELVIDEGRGQFLDRNGKPLSYEEKQVLVLFPFLKSLDWNSHELANILNVSVSQLNMDIENAKEPFIFGGKTPYILTKSESERINELKIPGVYAIAKKYTPNENPASQLIGIARESAETFQNRYPEKNSRANKKIGITGLQKNFDEFLLPENEAKLIYHVNGIKQPLFGMDVKYTGLSSPYYPLQVKTTIEKTYQEKIEDLLDEYNIKQGGAVLLDIQTNEILAIASRPSVNQKDPFSDQGTKNMMLEQHIPGSVFKTVIAAAAIEEGLVDHKELFNCSLDIYGEQAVRNLGQLNLEQSFARSCNRTFGELAVRLMKVNPNFLEEYAKKLSAIGELSWQGDLFQMKDFRQFDTDRGRLFLNDTYKKDTNYVTQTGIGQQEVRITPLGAANMMAIIARGGEKKTIRAVSEIQYGNGSPMYKFSEQKDDAEQISKYTAIKMQQLLKLVIEDPEGTGSVFQQLPYEIAGKSGTAETALFQNGKQLHNKWFAGYFPFKEPKYSLVVVNLAVPADEGGINMLFADIVNMIYNENNNAFLAFPKAEN